MITLDSGEIVYCGSFVIFNSLYTVVYLGGVHQEHSERESRFVCLEDRYIDFCLEDRYADYGIYTPYRHYIQIPKGHPRLGLAAYLYHRKRHEAG